MEHNHTHGANKKVLWISCTIITLYMFIEAADGFITNSLAGECGHTLTDSIPLRIALMAFTTGVKVADFCKTYGFRRFEILPDVLLV